MRRGSLTRSSSDMNLNHSYENSSTGSKGKTLQHRKCECCKNKAEHDYLRQQRQSRERKVFLRKQNAKVFKEKEQQSKEEERENLDPNIDNDQIHNIKTEEDVKIEDENTDGYLIKANQEVKDQLENSEQQIDLMNTFQKQLSLIREIRGQESSLNPSPNKFTPLPKKRLSLSEILEVQNSVFATSQLTKNPSTLLNMSIKISLQNKTYYKSWSDKQQIIQALSTIGQIFTNTQ